MEAIPVFFPGIPVNLAAYPPDNTDLPGPQLHMVKKAADFTHPVVGVLRIDVINAHQDILDLGVYMTTAVKCGKTGYNIKAGTIKECSLILEQELALFSDARVYLLMGDVAIRAVNYIARRAGEGRVIPAGSTYKIRGPAYYFRGARAFPSYLQAGPSFFIEKSKRQMIAADIAAALSVAGKGQ